MAGARLLGMLLSFLLFLVLARHSPTAAGIFRTVITYLVIAEFIGMLGMHRWLATEMAAHPSRRWSLFLATNAVMLIVAILLIAAYSGIAVYDFYSADINLGIELAALSLIPSGVYQCVQSAFIGIGRTYIVGVYNAIEYILRCTGAILLIYFDHPVSDVITVFVVSRWLVAIVGFYHLSHMLTADSWIPRLYEIKHVLHDAPKFLVIIIAHMALRNSALVMIPALMNDESVAYFSVAYQLFDMILIIPSVLAISSNHVFVNMANHSIAALNNVSIQLLSVTSIAMFPCIAITAAFSSNVLLFLYGSHYTIASHTLAILMLASGVTMLDQVLSQIMTAQKDYKSDMISILAGGISTAVLTYLLVLHGGIHGAAMAYLMASLITVAIRISILNHLVPFKTLWDNMAHPFLCAVIIYIVCCYARSLPFFAFLQHAKYWWLACVPPVLALYGLLLFSLGGLDQSKLQNIRNFLFQH